MESETFIAAAPRLIAARLSDPSLQSRWAGALVLQAYEDRGVAGCRSVVSGELVGSCEWWIEPVRDGAVVHFWLRAKPGREQILWRRRERLLLAQYGSRWRRCAFALKDELEAGAP